MEKKRQNSDESRKSRVNFEINLSERSGFSAILSARRSSEKQIL